MGRKFTYTQLVFCHVLTLVPLFCLCFSVVRVWVGVGSLCVFFYVGFCVRPSMVLNQRQVSLVVSDWESYLGSLGFTFGWWVFVSVWVFGPHGTVSFSVLFTSFIVLYFSVQFVLNKSSWTLTTLRFGPILLPPLNAVTIATIIDSHHQSWCHKRWS